MEQSDFNPYDQNEDTSSKMPELSDGDKKQLEKRLFKKANKTFVDDEDEDSFPPEELKERNNLINIILKYSMDDILGASIKLLPYELNKKALKKKTTQKLRSILEECQQSVMSSSMSGVVEGVYFNGLSVAETVSRKINSPKFDLTGLESACKSDPSILICLRQLSIENSNIFALPPSQRLIMSTVFCMLKQTTINRIQHAFNVNISNSQPEQKAGTPNTNELVLADSVPPKFEPPVVKKNDTTPEEEILEKYGLSAEPIN